MKKTPLNPSKAIDFSRYSPLSWLTMLNHGQLIALITAMASPARPWAPQRYSRQRSDACPTQLPSPSEPPAMVRRGSQG